MRHELDVRGNPVAGFYIEPGIDGIHALTPLVRDAHEINGVLVGQKTGEYSLMRELWEDSASTAWVGHALDDLLDFSRRRAPRIMDPRIAVTLVTLARTHDGPVPVAQIAGQAGLSVSRFQHLFTREAGVPFRRYRARCRMRTKIATIVDDNSFTAAAHFAGFSDQPHFDHDFRHTFGAPPSVSLRRLRAW